MRRIIFILLIFLTAFIPVVSAQNYFNLGSGITDIGAKPWNRSIDAYNYARPWLKDKLPALGYAPEFQLGFTAILARAFFISPQLAYVNAYRNSVNEEFQTALQIHRFSGSVNFDIFPMEFGLDTVSYALRPFLRFGAGASAFLPRIKFNQELATVNDLPYEPIVWTYQFHAGIGCRFLLNKWFSIMPVVQMNYYPSFELEKFAQALHGSLVPNLSNRATLIKPEFSIYFCFRMGIKNRHEF